MQPPVLIKEIPAQAMNERAAYGPFNLRDYIQSPDNAELTFSAELEDGNALPKGLICTSDGVLTGIPGENTQGIYQILVTAQNDAGFKQTTFTLTIKPSFATTDINYVDKLKSQIWEALEKQLPTTELNEMIARQITELDIYYLLERWGILKIWDAFNLEPEGPLIPLQLEGASEHYIVYDRGSCLIACPKDLFSHERTILDGIKTAEAMAREIHNRQWTIELAGFDKLVRAAWLELQHLADLTGRHVDIINFSPTPSDIKLYTNQSVEMRLNMDK